jgi:hypothetical protein
MARPVFTRRERAEKRSALFGELRKRRWGSFEPEVSRLLRRVGGNYSYMPYGFADELAFALADRIYNKRNFKATISTLRGILDHGHDRSKLLRVLEISHEGMRDGRIGPRDWSPLLEHLGKCNRMRIRGGRKPNLYEVVTSAMRYREEEGKPIREIVRAQREIIKTVRSNPSKNRLRWYYSRIPSL